MIDFCSTIAFYFFFNSTLLTDECLFCFDPLSLKYGPQYVKELKSRITIIIYWKSLLHIFSIFHLEHCYHKQDDLQYFCRKSSFPNRCNSKLIKYYSNTRIQLNYFIRNNPIISFFDEFKKVLTIVKVKLRGELYFCRFFLINVSR